MTKAGNSQIMQTITLLITIFSLSLPAQAQYSGGTGEPNDPYQIATAEDLMLFGENPEDYDKHFILTADIDLNPNSPGGKVFDNAVIAPDANDIEVGFQGTPFTGVFDGNDHIISHLTITGESYLGLFGWLEAGAQIHNLSLEAVDVNGIGDCVGGLVGRIWWGASITSSYVSGVVIGNEHVGGLVGYNFGSSITTTYSTGTVSGDSKVGGLVGSNGGSITTSHSTCRIDGVSEVGGLVGVNYLMLLLGPYVEGNVYASYSAGTVVGETSVGGLIGYNAGNVITSYSTGAVNGGSRIGGLVGANVRVGSSDSMSGAANGTITESYSTGPVTGNDDVGGLVGFYILPWEGDDITKSFWDLEASGQSSSAGGTGLTTDEMQDPKAFMTVGWDFIGQPDGPHDVWAESEGGGYPVLFWQVSPEFSLPKFTGGNGEPNNPYLISTAGQLNAIGHNPRLMDSHFKLIDDLDMTDCHSYLIGSDDSPCRSVFEGNGHVISNLTIEGEDDLGLFGFLGDGAEVKDLGVVDVNITSSGWWAGGLVGHNSGGTVTNCYSTGRIAGIVSVGGLVGTNAGRIIMSYSTGAVTGDGYVGGLVASNHGSIATSYSTGTVTGDHNVGGLVGRNGGTLANCYSTGAVTGDSRYVGGLVASNHGSVATSYSTGTVIGSKEIGGFVGANHENASITSSFWDVETSRQSSGNGGTGLTTTQMQDINTYLNAGWDFVDETENGTEYIWWILEGQDYPRLWWEAHD